MLSNVNISAQTEKLNLLVIGLDVVSLATSVIRAGHNVYSVDYFGDFDLRRMCKNSLSIITQIKSESCGKLNENFSPIKLLELFKKLLKKHLIDAVVLASGLEDFPEVLSLINDHSQILGNSPNLINNVRNKERFFQNLKQFDIPHPVTEVVEDFQEAKKKAKDIGYPIIIKPEKGFGGVGLRKVSNTKRFESVFKTISSISQRVLIQEFIEGKPSSASVISTAKRALTLTVNEQLLGVRCLGQLEPFGYCGNIVPLSTSKIIIERCKKTAERVISLYKLIGSNGVDFVISKEGTPKVVEVNPRFQGTLECVEVVLGINFFKAHLDACTLGILPKNIKNSGCYCTRLILFAPERSKVPDLSTYSGVRDIPFPGVIIEKGEPLCSVIREDLNRKTSLAKANDVAGYIFQSLLSMAN